jgi:hypothetical protein
MFKDKMEAFTNARLRHLLERPPPEYPNELPEHRGEWIIKNFDFGEKITVVNLFKARNITQYRVIIDDVLWKECAGINKIQAELRRRNPPVTRVY